ncbi:uncharacterized protein HD556DRAFT_517266 [Suillus plorans]|uniref:NACHT domain-containing protein n=1 Tax=Suillus plorans TaxID=116603 RepID=A0A9P7APN6_9AGAM|nr:uncharacterized protein HD556DRAFT_517266 [Suillus plorans]KAG1793067.1 hypothetical protein HD556DRAFT_517266 [Suillus plorans]
MSQDHFSGSFEGTWEKLSQVAVKGAEYDSRERRPHPKCLQGTRVDLLNYIRRLLDDQEKSRLIWLHGTAGVGKSAVAFTVAETMRDLKVTEETHVEKRLAGTFFFSRKHTKRCTTGYFFVTLVYQLASNFASVRNDVNRTIRDNPALLDPDKSLRDQLEALFIQPLRRLQLRLRGCPPLAFVVDALDECTSETELADLILYLARALREPHLPVVHILLTSRSESHICKAFQNAEVYPLVCEIPVKTSGEGVAATISLDGADVDKDIYIFLHHSFTELQSRHPDFPQPSRDELERLASRAGRRFIVASTMMKFIDDGDSDPRDRLQVMLDLASELLPGTEVYELYDRILSTCADPKRAYQHLSIVAALADPLPISQLSKLLGPGLGRDVETALVQLRSIMDIPTDGSLPVNIYHSSVRDYVSDPSNCNLSQVHNILSPHSILAYSSFRLMMKEIPERSALLDMLSDLKKHSRTMKSQDPQRLKESLSFLVQPPEPLSVLVALLWFRGDRSPDLEFWLGTQDGRAWLQTPRGTTWLCAMGGENWLQTQEGQDWLQTQGGKDWLQIWAGIRWLWSLGGSIWLLTKGGNDWLRTQQGKASLQSQLGKEWLKTVLGTAWLESQGGKDWLKSQERGNEVRKGDRPSHIGVDWVFHHGDSLPEIGGKVQITGMHKIYAPTQQLISKWNPQNDTKRMDWLKTHGGLAWLLTQEGEIWLQSFSGRKWLRIQGGKDWLGTIGGNSWLRTQGGRCWLQTLGGRGWLKTPGAQNWLETQDGQDWLETKHGWDWLETKHGRNWLQCCMRASDGRGWLQTKGGRNWLQTQGGRDWLETPDGETWQATPAASVWVTMEEFSNTLKTISEHKFVPESSPLLAFQAIQQFRTLPDVLIFPVFLSLRHQNHSNSALPESRFSPDRKIIHAMNAFMTFANEAQERSQSVSEALKYACQNWALHLSRAPNPLDEKISHIYKAFWNRHLLSWLERQWCLKGLQSCLIVLSTVQTLAKPNKTLPVIVPDSGTSTKETSPLAATTSNTWIRPSPSILPLVPPLSPTYNATVSDAGISAKRVLDEPRINSDNPNGSAPLKRPKRD